MAFDKIAFGRKLAALRAEAGLSQQAAGQMLGVTDKAISKWENGLAHPSLEFIPKIAELYSTSVGALFAAAEVSNKQIMRVVLTGGPCAGKSTAVSWIMEDMQNKGWKVIFVPEVPTELINAGISPASCGGMAAFNKCVFGMQLMKEEQYLTYAKNIPADKVMLVFDRGLMDCKAYLSSTEFASLLRDANLTETQARDRYDAVFHLVTAAKGAEKFYTSANNTARSETPAQAIELDEKTAKAWAGHPKLRVFDNSTGFEEKMQRLLVALSDYTGGPVTANPQRKLLVEMPDIKALKAIPGCTKVETLQTYLKSPDARTIRLRQRGLNGDYMYTKTVQETERQRGMGKLGRGILYEEPLTEAQYLAELMNADLDLAPIRCDRYYFIHDDEYIQVDIYPFMKNHALLAYPFTNKDDKLKVPDMFTVVREVTEDPAYLNINMAKGAAKRDM